MIKIIIKILTFLGVGILGGLLFRGILYDKILQATFNFLSDKSWLFLLIIFFTVFGVGAFIRWLLRWAMGSLEEVRYKRSLKRKWAKRKILYLQRKI